MSMPKSRACILRTVTGHAGNKLCTGRAITIEKLPTSPYMYIIILGQYMQQNVISRLNRVKSSMKSIRCGAGS